MAHNINDYPEQMTSVDGDDLLKCHDTTAATEKKIDKATFVAGYLPQVSAPTTGQTVECTATQDTIWLRIAPAGTLNALTVKVPTKTIVLDGQLVIITFTQAITALTMNANGASGIVPTITAAAAGQTYQFRYHAVDDTWYLMANATV